MKALFLTITACVLIVPVQAKYGGGTGELNNPYVISTAEQMNAIGTDPNDWDTLEQILISLE
jgi:hypothetical protein